MDHVDWAFSTRGGNGSQGLTTEQARMGTQSYKFSLTPKTARDTRQELTLANKFIPGYKRSNFKIGHEYWVGFSMFLADGYYSNEYIVHHQLHGVPDKPPRCDPVEDWRNPIFTITGKEGKMRVTSIADSKPCTINKDYTSRWGKNLGIPITGRWVDYVYNIKFSYGADGFLKLWQDGILVAEHDGENCFNDARGPYMKIGIYGQLEIGQTVTVYYDQLRIGDNESSYAAVDPGRIN